MGRKRKQINNEDESMLNLPPCRVCDAPGAGFHYGANTCEACKGFFHRSLKINSQYKCEGDNRCAIEHGRNRLCQYCRYQKCLSVGMAKEAIKTGRYTSVKRTNDILEIKSLEMRKRNKPLTQNTDGPNQTPSSLSGICSDNGGESSLDCDSQTGHQSLLFENTVGQISSDVAVMKSEISDSLIINRDSELVAEVCQRPCVSFCGQGLIEMDIQCQQSFAKIDNFVKTEGSSDTSTFQEIESLFFESPDGCNHITAYQRQYQNMTLSSAMSPLSITSPYGSPSESSITKPSPGMLTDIATSLLSLSSAAIHSSSSSVSTHATSTLSPSSLTSVNSPATSMLSPGSVTLSPAPSAVNGASSSVSQQDLQMYISDSSNSVYDTRCDFSDKSVSEMYKDKDLIVGILLEADENFVVPLAGRMTEEEIKRQQQEHFEACCLQREMFGQLRRLPDHEYDYIFATTGLDTDDRQKRLRIMGAGLEKVIRAMVKFCKVIPGFCKLDIFDKVKLIKYSRQEFCLFIIYKFINAERKIMRGFDNQWKCENEISRMSSDTDSNVFMENLDIHFRFCRDLQNLKLSDEELVVIRALVVMAPDRDPHVDSPIAREIHWELNECLIHVLSRRYPNPLPAYAKIVGKLTEARSQTENMIRFFKRLKIEKYSNLMDNPLLREMCSGIFFDDKDEDGLNWNS